MNRFLFNRTGYDRMFNCSMKTLEEWKAIGHENPYVGGAYITLGAVYQTMYFCCMIVMARPEFIKISCYKIMFLIGIFDMANIIIASFLAGYFSIIGAVFCTSPEFQYVVGTGTAGRHLFRSFIKNSSDLGGHLCAGLLLAFNQCMEITSTYWSQKLFSGKRTYVWLVFPIGYALQYWFFQEPGSYSSLGYAWMTDPYYGLDIGNKEDYTPRFLMINNYSMIVVLTSLYIYLSAGVILKREFKYGEKIMKVQMSMIIQSVLICLLLYLTCIFYTLMLWLEIHTTFFVVMAEFGWQTSHGGVPIVYLIFNKSMRKAIFEMFLPACLQKRLDPKRYHFIV